MDFKDRQVRELDDANAHVVYEKTIRSQWGPTEFLHDKECHVSIAEIVENKESRNVSDWLAQCYNIESEVRLTKH
jgi:hypothetical protein